jgi:hypothetical protein
MSNNGPRILVDYQNLSELTDIAVPTLRQNILSVPTISGNLGELQAEIVRLKGVNEDLNKNLKRIEIDLKKARDDNEEIEKKNESTRQNLIFHLARIDENLNLAREDNERTEQNYDITHQNLLSRLARIDEELNLARQDNGKTEKKCESQNENLLSLREELTNTRHSFKDGISRRGEAHDADEKVQDADVDDEPGIAVEDQLRIKEQSAKAIDIYTESILSSVWLGCSKSTYGKLNHMICVQSSPSSSFVHFEQMLTSFSLHIAVSAPSLRCIVSQVFLSALFCCVGRATKSN